MRYMVPILIGTLLYTTAYPQETRPERRVRQGQAATYASRDVSALSMMGWGLGISVGIATLCALVKNNESSSSTSH